MMLNNITSKLKISKAKYLGSLISRAQTAAAKPIQKPASARKERQMDKDAKQSKSFVTNMFLGKVNTEELMPYPVYLNDEQISTLKMIIPQSERFFAEAYDAAENDKQERISEESMKALGELGAFGLQVPVEYGGIGLSNLQYGRMGEVLGANDLGLSVALGAHQSIGFKGILIFGNEDQKAKYLPQVASGEKIAAFCLTEPSSGSDAGSIRSRAVPSKDGSYYTLNGSKIWISNGGIADVFTVFAQVPIYDEKTKSTKEKVTAFFVERAFGGVSSGPPEKKLGIKCSNTAEVFFDNVKVPAENMLGEPGNGFKVAMEILNNGRFGMGAGLTGTMRYAIGKAVEFATNRTQFGSKIDNFGTIQEKLARMAMNHYISESMYVMVASNMDRGSKDYHLEAAVSKIFSSEAAWTTVDEAIQVMGGMGYMRESGLERYLRDLRIFRIFEGTNDILRLLVALTGLQFAGGHLKELQNALKNPAVNLGLILGEGTKRARRAIGINQGEPLKGIHGNLTDSGLLVSNTIELFGATAEHLLAKHGKRIIEQQFLLNRLANSAIDIYSSAVILARASRSLEMNVPTAAHEEKLVNVWTSEAMNRATQNLTATKSSNNLKNYDIMSEISKDLCNNGGVVAQRVLGV